MSPQPWLAFLALCRRDLHVFVRVEPLDFIAQALLSPVFMLLVFGRVLPAVGAADAAYADDLLPGVFAITLVLTALQGAATPLISSSPSRATSTTGCSPRSPSGVSRSRSSSWPRSGVGLRRSPCCPRQR